MSLIVAVLATAAAPAAAETAVGVVKAKKSIVTFDTSAPGTFTSSTPITGLPVGGFLADVDFRVHPSSAIQPAPPPQLFGLVVIPSLAYEVALYTVDAETGVLTPVGPAFTHSPAGFVYGIDFNPTSDRVRVLNDYDGNFRVNPVNGARSDSPTPDNTLSPAGRKVVGIAYDRVTTVPPVPSSNSTAYAIGWNPGQLYTVGSLNQTPQSANSGTLLNEKPLGVAPTPSTPIGFDIDTSGKAYATMVAAGGQPGLYTINLETGAATLVGKLKEALDGFAILPGPVPSAQPGDSTAPSISIQGVKKKLSFKAFLKGVAAKVTPSEPAALTGELRGTAKGGKSKPRELASFRVLAKKSLPLAAGQRTLKLKPKKRRVGRPEKAFKVRLKVTATDAAGNAGTVTRTITVKPPKPKKK
jgi:hypothetical protein